MEEFKCGEFACAAERVGEGSVVVAISGELDMHNSEEVGHLLGSLHERGITDHLIIDLTDCTFIDSIGLSVLIRAQHMAKSPLNVVVTHQALRRVLSVTGLSSIFALHETKADALDELQRQVGTL
jgi:anti-anti-sigma factor